MLGILPVGTKGNVVGMVFDTKYFAGQSELKITGTVSVKSVSFGVLFLKWR